MKEAYAYFYVLGREERPFKNDIDTEQLAKKVLDDKGTIHDVALAAASAAAESLRIDRKKRLWLDEYEDEIAKAGGDKDLAWNHFIDGRIDTVTAELEDAIFDDLAEAVAPSEDDDDEGDDEDDDDEEDDEE